MPDDINPSDWSALTQRVDAIETSLQTNTAATERIEATTTELMDLIKSFQGAMRVLGWIGKLARPMGYIAMAVGAVVGMVSAIKGGGVTPK